MARGTQHRKRRADANARRDPAAAAVATPRRKKKKQAQWEDQLFFQRLRVHAKWAFVLLALVFGLGFVFLGIGSGSNGVTDALQNAFNFGNGSGGASISSLERKTRESPGDAQAWRDLATAYETKHRTHDAIVALQQYTGLRPKDTGALAELASQYGQQAQQYATDYQSAEAQIALATPASAAFAPPATTPLGKAFNDPNALKDPISSAVQSLLQEKMNTALSNYQSAQRNAQASYQKIVDQTPNDANAVLQLAQAAQSANDVTTALANYRKFLKLSPTDPLVAQVKQQIQALEAQTAPATSSSGSK